MRTISMRGMKALIQWEGFEQNAYEDSGGALTIGIGHLLTKKELATGLINIGGQKVEWKNGLTKEQVYTLKHQDLDRVYQDIDPLLPPDLTQTQYDAMVMFVFNIGITQFLGSSVLKRIRDGLYDQVPARMKLWNKDNGKVVKGLVNRRNAEIELWESEDE